MARTVYDFQSPNRKTAIGKSREAVSREIMQFDDATFETRLDALVKARVERIVNAMLDAEADEIANAARYERSGGRKACHAPEPRHVPAWRHAGGSELVIVPWMAMTKSAQPFGNYRVRTFSWRLNEKIIICPAPRNDSARWTCISPRR